MEKLELYLEQTRHYGESKYDRYARFGEQLGGISMYGVRKWIYGQRRVPDEMKKRIEVVTRGRVTMRDLVLS